ncbi:hypothetical protein [Streptomyces halobius]|uniref:Uncharacterized protein n=1 Tax=Streptomyces halobius TaxID=2879846 RepID=A0ABY4LYW0_9ACTN|nr:hypothetical protein [Streptomyces halobius]UQA90694.1 hypothetical protein K9S39_01220 [Streptomyces halobius]
MHANTQMDGPKKGILRTFTVGAALAFALAAGSATAVPLAPHVTAKATAAPSSPTGVCIMTLYTPVCLG